MTTTAGETFSATPTNASFNWRASARFAFALGAAVVSTAGARKGLAARTIAARQSAENFWVFIFRKGLNSTWGKLVLHGNLRRFIVVNQPGVTSDFFHCP